MSLESDRAYLSHTVLANGFFAYLSEPASLWQDGPADLTQRASRLAQHWKEAAGRANSLRSAHQAWRTAGRTGVASLAKQLHGDAHRSAQVRPTAAFPSSEDISKWLDEIERFLNKIEADGYRYVPGSEADAETFWLAALRLYEFVQGLAYDSPMFWNYFELT